jgi:hypothetical protein
MGEARKRTIPSLQIQLFFRKTKTLGEKIIKCRVVSRMRETRNGYASSPHEYTNKL